MKKILMMLTLLVPCMAHAQQHIMEAAVQLERFQDATALVLEAERDTRHPLWMAGYEILSGEIENVPDATFATVAEALVELVASSEREVFRQAADIIRDAGLAGYDGAADALYRAYEGRLEARLVDGLGTISRHLADQPDGRGLSYLARMATRNNDDFAEADMHGGVHEGS